MLESFLLGMSRHRPPAIADETDTRDRNQLLELFGGPAAQDDDVGKQPDEPAQRLQGFRKRDRLGRVGNDLRQGAVEVGDETSSPGGTFATAEFRQAPTIRSVWSMPISYAGGGGR